MNSSLCYSNSAWLSSKEHIVNYPKSQTNYQTSYSMYCEITFDYDYAYLYLDNVFQKVLPFYYFHPTGYS